jgi:hypothetical protein
MRHLWLRLCSGLRSLSNRALRLDQRQGQNRWMGWQALPCWGGCWLHRWRRWQVWLYSMGWGLLLLVV